MTDLTLTRQLPDTIERVFDILTNPKHVPNWWGPEAIVEVEGHINLGVTGPYSTTMVSEEGKRFKVSGRVTSVKKPNLVAFTWGWHDENDQRGHESHVQIELAENDGETMLTLTHTGLPDDDSAANHETGWTSSLRSLATYTTSQKQGA